MKEYFLADDLSGALDAGAAFHHAGRRVRIVLSAADWTASDDEVVGVTTETRNAPPEVAAAVVGRAMIRGRAQGARLVYKKIDSTLRGPVAAELAALARQLPDARILFTPANPGVGRTVCAGVLLVRGVPVHETEFAGDPVSPVTEGNLHRLLGGAGGDRVVVADAASEADLAGAVARMAAAGGDWVAVGSGALARPVARLGARATIRNESEDTSWLPAGPVLLLGGSAHPGNRVQAERLARRQGVPLHELDLADPGATVDAAAASLRHRGSAIVLSAAARGDSAVWLRALAATGRDVVAATGANRLFLTGGETAWAVAAALGITALELHAELESGLILSRAATPGGRFLLAIKPGGFGTADAWVRAWERLRE